MRHFYCSLIQINNCTFKVNTKVKREGMGLDNNKCNTNQNIRISKVPVGRKYKLNL